MAPTTQISLYLEEKQGDFIIGNTIPVPKPKAGEILIKVMAAGLNPIDWALKATGMFIEKYPYVLGLDYAGTVEELGEGVVDLKVGDRVYVYQILGNQRIIGLIQDSIYQILGEFVPKWPRGVSAIRIRHRIYRVQGKLLM